MPEHMHIPEGEERLDEGTAEALRSLYGGRLEVPSAVDEGVLAAARMNLHRRPGWGRGWGWRIGGLAAAMVFGVGVWAWRGASPWTGGAKLVGDLDADGRVDIVDALCLAREIEAGGAGSDGRDVNGDGGVDRGDVDAIAAMAVALRGGAS